MGVSLTTPVGIIARERICLVTGLGGKHRRGDKTHDKNKNEGFWINEFLHP